MFAYTMNTLTNNAEEAKEKGSTPKPKPRPVSPMTGEITGDRCQTCQKDETNHHSFEF